MERPGKPAPLLFLIQNRQKFPASPGKIFPHAAIFAG
jgi:hypothetical protein